VSLAAQETPGLNAAAEAARRRRTFAIISHPDAGKTTLTEKLLLLGGAIRMAGAVRARGEGRRTRSDWMKIEQARGISVTTSVMTFEDQGLTFNLLDTPGHEDFSEDTYRTLTAVDSAVMVLDAAKGIEAQTRKLFEVCRLRDVPIITFINKMDREGRDPFELLDEIADLLALDVVPVTWPIDMGARFQGCYDLINNRLLPFAEGGEAPAFDCSGPDDPQVADHLGAAAAATLVEEIELVRAACPAFDLEAYRGGHLTPVLFGSALKGYGVRTLLDRVAQLAPPPQPRPAEPRPIDPSDPQVSGFVFKVQANMDPNHRDRIAFMRLCSGRFRRGMPNHRDRIAFMRLCSGRFRRGMKLRQAGSGKTMGIRNPILFFAQDRELAEEAWPGDVIGVPNHGTLRVGDSLSEDASVRFTGIPNFAPEILRRIRLDDPLRAKQLRRALEDMAEEGVTQIFRPMTGAAWIVGVVGQLQLDVLATRFESEYKLAAGFEAAPYQTARWIAGEAAEVKRFIDANQAAMAEDRDGAPVYLARNVWELNYTKEHWPKIRFEATRERS
jgi:peptide chain release factor 3